jgi:ribosomal protein L37AE/L43A
MQYLWFVYIAFDAHEMKSTVRKIEFQIFHEHACNVCSSKISDFAPAAGYMIIWSDKYTVI